MSKMFEDMKRGLEEVNAFLAGESAGYKVTLPAEIDVKSIRKRLKMTQARFSDTFGFSLDAVKHWEGGRRTPEASARAFLTVIARNPGAVIEALHSREAK
jgi:putative transcriptional regulator